MATTRQPHLVPIVFCELHGNIYSPVDGKRKNGRPLKRLRNLSENSQASLLLDHYSMDWETLWWVRIDGTAEVFEATASIGAEIARRLMEKYPQYSDPSLMFDQSLFVRLVPAQVSAWSQSGSDAAIDTAVSELLRD